MPFTIRKMLALPPFHGAELVAGASGLNNPISGISITESEDLDQKGMRNSVLLTSVFYVVKLSDQGVDFVKRCREQHSAGIVIKQGKNTDFFLLDHLRKEADAAGIPVIMLKNQVDLSKVIRLVTYEVFRNEGYDLRRTIVENLIQELIAMSQDPAVLLRRGSMLELQPEETICVMLIQPAHKHAAEVRNFCQNQWDHRCFADTKNNRVTVALCVREDEKSPESLTRIAENLLENLELWIPGEQFHIGIGRPCNILTDFQHSFLDAACALSYSLLTREESTIRHFTDLGVYRILFDYKNRQDLFKLYRDTVGVIEDYDRNHGTEYMKLVRCFFQEGESVQRTARSMQINHHTVTGRLNRIRSLFGIDLFDEHDRVDLYVSIIAADSQDLWETYKVAKTD